MPVKPALEAATPLEVMAPEEPEMALARGAALASANAPLFASSTAALAYALDPGTGEVSPRPLGPTYLDVWGNTDADALAYSAVADEDDVTPRRRRPMFLAGSALAGIAAVVAGVVLFSLASDRPGADRAPEPAGQRRHPGEAGARRSAERAAGSPAARPRPAPAAAPTAMAAPEPAPPAAEQPAPQTPVKPPPAAPVYRAPTRPAPQYTPAPVQRPAPAPPPAAPPAPPPPAAPPPPPAAPRPAPGHDVPAFPVRHGADSHHPAAAAGAPAGAVRTWRTTATARTLGSDGMSGEEVAWANTVRSDLIPTSSIE